MADKPLPEINENITNDLSRLSIQDTPSIDQETRKALTDPRIFESVPAVLPSSSINIGILPILCPRKTTNKPHLSIPRRTPRTPLNILIIRVKDNTTSSFFEHNIFSPPIHPYPSLNYGHYGSFEQNHSVFYSLHVSPPSN
jgi:hypothetical protein